LICCQVAISIAWLKLLIDLQVFINESEQVALYFLLFRIETGWLHCYAVNQKELKNQAVFYEG